MINSLILVLVLMILGHLIADYLLQGWLAKAKAKSYWENSPKENRKDYIAALLAHSTMWGIIVFIPIMGYSWGNLGWLWLLLPVNIAIHCIVDDLKANKKKINLIQDQSLHIAQILITWVIWFVFIGII